jgi:hypothetical protein
MNASELKVGDAVVVMVDPEDPDTELLAGITRSRAFRSSEGSVVQLVGHTGVFYVRGIVHPEGMVDDL